MEVVGSRGGGGGVKGLWPGGFPHDLEILKNESIPGKPGLSWNCVKFNKYPGKMM